MKFSHVYLGWMSFGDPRRNAGECTVSGKCLRYPPFSMGTTDDEKPDPENGALAKSPVTFINPSKKNKGIRG